MWHIGQKVVCITDAWRGTKPPMEVGPQKGQKYTIRDILTFSDVPDRIFFHLEEILNKPWYLGPFGKLIECSFCSSGFRPLEEDKKETDISIFKTNRDKLPSRELVDG